MRFCAKGLWVSCPLVPEEQLQQRKKNVSVLILKTHLKCGRNFEHFYFLKLLILKSSILFHLCFLEVRLRWFELVLRRQHGHVGQRMMKIRDGL